VTRWICLVAVLISLVIAGCTSPKTADRPALRPVTLPDLSQMAESARKQIEERHASLLKTSESRTATVVDLSSAYGEMGKLLMAAQYADPAEACFLNAQTLDPSEFRWPYYLAHLYRKQGELTKSQSLFERAIQLHPDDVSTLVWLGNTYLEQGLPDAAEPQFAKALSLEPKSISARYGLGRTALAKNDPRRAVTYLEELLEINPKAGDAHYPLSMAYTALGDSAKASQHLRLRSSQGIYPADPLMAELDSLLQSPQTYETLGIQALGHEDWPTAAREFRHGLELSPNSPSLRFRLATTMNMMGDAAGGEALLEAVVHDAPEYFPAQFSLGVILQAKGRHGEAVERFTAALAQRQDYAEARLRLASSLRRLGRGKEALSNYEQVAKANPDLVEAQVGYAMTLAQLGRYQEARDRFAQQMALHPDQLSFRHGLARLLVAAPDDRVRDGGHAMSLVQAMMAQGRTPELGETLAMTFAELGQFAQAVALQRDLLSSAERAGVTSVKARLARNLQLYEKGQPCRTPWTDEEMP
jgi:tetratricopeptide (TPR) repeat protein